MDFITCLPKVEGKNVIMVVVDRLTKYAHLCALSHPFSASIVVASFINTVQKLHGSLKIIVSDIYSQENFGLNMILLFGDPIGS